MTKGTTTKLLGVGIICIMSTLSMMGKPSRDEKKTVAISNFHKTPLSPHLIEKDSLIYTFGDDLEFSIAELDSLSLELDEDDEDMFEEGDTTGSSWDATKVNPFNITIDSIVDTVINVSTYSHPNFNVVTSECGERWGRFHAGTDMRLRVGDTIRAAFDGKVRIMRYNKKFRKKGYGHFVMLRHPNGLETLYGHLYKPLVKVNQEVKSGEPIGLGGNTGRSTGPHLHLEFRYKGLPINARKIVDFETGQVLNPKLEINKSTFDTYNEYLHSPAKYHKVRKGDTLGKIARRYRTSVKRLCALNRIRPNTKLKIGRRLRVK
ncbi:MAG: M23 family metallopeptidase [Bacteroidales bacterium]|nr:M23 family metallopeptidase [Bacteroidales bacterium]